MIANSIKKLSASYWSLLLLTLLAGKSLKAQVPMASTSQLVKDWPMIAQKHADGLTAFRQKEQAPYDLNHDGDIDEGLWEKFAEARFVRRTNETLIVKAELLKKFDLDKDGKLTRLEVSEILETFRESRREKVGSNEQLLKRRLVYLKYFDMNADELVDDVESELGFRFEMTAKTTGNPSDEISLDKKWSIK